MKSELLHLKGFPKRTQLGAKLGLEPSFSLGQIPELTEDHGFQQCPPKPPLSGGFPPPNPFAGNFTPGVSSFLSSVLTFDQCMFRKICNFIYLSFFTDYKLKGEDKRGFKETHIQLKYYANVFLGILHSFATYGDGGRGQQPVADIAAPSPKAP